MEPRNAANAKRYEKERTRLAGKFGREPSAGDMKWAILNHDLLLHARNMDWGLYRNARLQMADILAREHRTSDALAAYLEVCYLDLNGPSNCGGISGDLLEEYPPWQVLDGFLAPGVVVRKNSIRHESKIDTNNKELE